MKEAVVSESGPKQKLIESNLSTNSDIRMLQTEIHRFDNDLAKTKADLQKEIQQTRALLQKEIEISASKTKVEIIKWVAALLLAQAGLIFILVKVFG